ncbi:MAG TPA: metalloprotease PmbA [Burkholderiales bacterium]|nr:metalloprotease PmbA [Burkholderiales bacterium]
MARARFSHDLDALKAIAADALAHAAQKGATACEAEASDGYGQTVTVRKGEIETIEYNRDKSLSVTVYSGKRKGYASTADFGARAIRETVEAALTIARFTAEDEAAGLANPEDLARDPADLDLFHPWDLPVERAIEIAKACEAAAFRLDKRVVNSEGASVSCQQWQFALGNSHGFMEGYPTSRHTLSCAVIVAEDDQMQRDDWYASQRAAQDLPDAEAVGDYAGRRALARLRSRKIGTVQASVLFEAPVANDLLATFVSAASGGNLYRKTSFLLEGLGKEIFSTLVTLVERPHLPRAQASSWYDDEGVATRDRDVVKDGVLRGYFLGSYSARKLGMKTTGSAGGNHNLILQGGDLGLPALIRRMGRGLLVTELIGFGVNLVTGDYSRGAAGFWVEGGEIRHPVEEITIAGNLRDMFRSIAAIGSDALTRGSRTCGSILVEGMTIAGN